MCQLRVHSFKEIAWLDEYSLSYLHLFSSSRTSGTLKFIKGREVFHTIPILRLESRKKCLHPAKSWLCCPRLEGGRGGESRKEGGGREEGKEREGEESRKRVEWGKERALLSGTDYQHIGG